MTDRNNRCGRLTGGDFSREIRSGEHARPRRVVMVEHLGDDFGHAPERPLLDPLREADHRRAAADERPRLREDGSKTMGRHCDNDDVRIGARRFE